MSAELLSIFLDVIVLIFLGITIYYALKLSRSLNNFRAYKKEFNGLITDLNTHIEQAYEAVKALKERSNRSADDLEYLLRESQKMGEELKVINQSSNSMANRLEKAAGKSRAASPSSVDVSDFEDDGDGDVDEQLYSNIENLERSSSPSFSIEDREFSEGGEGTDDFQSEAEKDLYEALQKNKKSRSRRA